jgi:hypothetical protein
MLTQNRRGGNMVKHNETQHDTCPSTFAVRPAHNPDKVVWHKQKKNCPAATNPTSNQSISWLRKWTEMRFWGSRDLHHGQVISSRSSPKTNSVVQNHEYLRMGQTQRNFESKVICGVWGFKITRKRVTRNSCTIPSNKSLWKQLQSDELENQPKRLRKSHTKKIARD